MAVPRTRTGQLPQSRGALLHVLQLEMLRRTWQHRIEDLESYFILDFVRRYGVYPICNNKSGFESGSSTWRPASTSTGRTSRRSNSKMSETAKSGQQVIDDFFAEIDGMEGVAQDVVQVIKVCIRRETDKHERRQRTWHAPRGALHDQNPEH